MIERILDFNDPINRKDFFGEWLKRLLLLWLILFIYYLVSIGFNSTTTNSSLVEYLLEENRDVILVFGTILFLPLEIIRIKNINISLNWLYLAYISLYLPFPEDGNSLISLFENISSIYYYIFYIYLFIKKGSNYHN
tara:strand:- start:493 stop:903 length:411 start_codon:yes stop_codon:yes gene_type:complete